MPSLAIKPFINGKEIIITIIFKIELVHLVEFKIKFWYKYSKPGCQIQIMNTEEKKMALVHFKVDYRRWSIMMKTHFENVNINFLDSDTIDDFKQQRSKTELQFLVESKAKE